ncbi:MAG: hypothetical protein ACOCN0_07355 [Prevotella sp.]
MKKIIATLALCTSIAGLQAQTINRMVIVPQAGYPQGYAINNVDSVFFTTVGRAAADVTLNKSSFSATGDTLWLAITPTADCAKYRITTVTKARADVLTSPASLESYLDNVNAPDYYQAFTNAQMTGFETPFAAGADYSILTLGYDKYNTPSEISRVDFTTPSTPYLGNPSVSWVATDSTTTTITMTFTPNSDCASYTFCLFEEGTAEQQFEQWAPMFGFANLSDMIKQFGYNVYTSTYTNTWTSLAPGKRYDIYILPMDANDVYAPLILAKASTKKQGGEGIATVDITIGDFKSSDGSYYQEVTYTPNDQASLHRDMIIAADAYNTAEWGEAGVLAYLKGDNPYDPYWNQYGVDNATWNADPSTNYIAFSIAKNINDEWGPLAMKEFTTPATPSAVAHKAPALGNRKPTTEVNVFGKAPRFNARKMGHGIILEQK